MTPRFAYDQSCEPPAPVLPLRLTAPGGEMAVLLVAMVDTGADCSLIPARVARDLRLPAVDRALLEGVGGRAGLATVHAASVELPGLRCLAQVVAHGSEALIGRDLLRRLVLRLDGPADELTLARMRRRRDPARS